MANAQLEQLVAKIVAIVIMVFLAITVLRLAGVVH